MKQIPLFFLLLIFALCGCADASGKTVQLPVKLSDAEYEVNETIYDESWEELLNILYSQDSEALFIKESEEAKEPELQLQKLPETLNLETGEILKIDSSDNYGRTTMLPRIQAYDGRLAYIVGEETEGEFPQSFAVADDQVVYHSSLNVLYVTDTAAGDCRIVEDLGGGVDKGALIGREYLYIRSGALWGYHMDSREKSLYYKQDGFWCNAVRTTDEGLYIGINDTQRNDWYYIKYTGK